MNTIGKVAIILTVIFLISFTICIIAGPVQLFTGFESTSISQFERASIQEVNELKINLLDEDIYIYPVSGNEIEFSLTGTYARNKYLNNMNLSVEKEGNTIYARVIYPNNLVLINKHLKLDVGIPESYFEKLNVNSASGDIDIKNLETEEFNVRAISGEIKIENIDNSGDSLIKTSSGDIDVRDFDSDKTRVESISGEIDCINIKSESEFYSETSSGHININNLETGKSDFKSVSGEIIIVNSKNINSARTSSGSVEINGLILENNLNIRTVSGEVSLGLIKGSSIDLDFESVSGDLENDFGDIYGGDYEVFVKTSSGDLKIS